MKRALFIAVVFVTLMSGPLHAAEKNMQIKIFTEAAAAKGKPETFTATLYGNATARKFKKMLPLELDMGDLHGNEKYFDLPDKLPTKDTNPGRIRAGDLMVWDSRTVVLFYKDFPTSYSYTKIGHINDTSCLADAVGSGNVKVTFELNEGEKL